MFCTVTKCLWGEAQSGTKLVEWTADGKLYFGNVSICYRKLCAKRKSARRAKKAAEPSFSLVFYLGGVFLMQRNNQKWILLPIIWSGALCPPRSFSCMCEPGCHKACWEKECEDVKNKYWEEVRLYPSHLERQIVALISGGAGKGSPALVTPLHWAS